MKKLGKLILVGALAFGTLQAKELFNLKAQDFEYTLLGKKSKSAKYKVNDNVLAETNLVKSNKGFYYTKVSSKKLYHGFFNIEILKDLSNFAFNSNIIYNSIPRNDNGLLKSLAFTQKRYIKFIDDKGSTIVISFNKDGITINDKEFKAQTNQETINLNVTINNKNLEITINSNKLFEGNYNFNKLKFIDTTFISSQVDTYQRPYTFDKLSGIKLISND